MRKKRFKVSGFTLSKVPMRLPSQCRRTHKQRESGYVLLTLILVMALLAIAAGMLASSIAFEIKRDREEEMIHRGVQYSRAIRAYYKKFGRYPVKMEDLENTSQLRFLRKRYKDPLTNKDFRLLHFGEAKLSLNGIGMIPGGNAMGSVGGLTGAPGFAQQPSTFGRNSAFGASTGSAPVQNPGVDSSFGQNPPDATQTGAGDNNNQLASDAGGGL